jgi:ATP/maltotriose-dependent transcriptional regulator MalT
MRRHAAVLVRVLDEMKLPVFVFEGGRQIYANGAATELADRLRAHDRIELRVVLLDYMAALEADRHGDRPAATVTLLTSQSGEPFYLRAWPVSRPGTRRPTAYAVSVRSSGADVPAIRRRYRLSAREGQVTELLLRGWGNREIAQALTIALPTTKKHLGRIFDKVGVDSRAQLLAKLG